MKRGAKIGLAVGAGLILLAVIATAGPEPQTFDPAKGINLVTVYDAPSFRPLPGIDNFVMIADPKTPGEDLEAAARRHCAGRQFCTVLAWTDAADAPVALPMTYLQVSAQVFSYSLNRTTGHERSLWNCKVYPQPSPGRCMADQVR